MANSLLLLADPSQLPLDTFLTTDRHPSGKNTNLVWKLEGPGQQAFRFSEGPGGDLGLRLLPKSGDHPTPYFPLSGLFGFSSSCPLL